ncbi:MAG: SDR family oxidoreductase [Bacteroidetes bacterium]|nr:MAG: SDR family oxidoreductase [Bacteroidota bacterium]
MKIAIFGASGRTGILAVYQALDKGHLVTAFSRSAANVTIAHPKITIIEGDVMDYEKVRQAVEGQEAVLVALGMENKPIRTLSGGTANIIRAMKETGVKRLIVVSSAGILGNDTHPVFGKIIIPLSLKHVFRDKKRQTGLIRESGLEWVIIRPPRLTQAPKTGKYQLTEGRPGTRSVPRADVADFMLKLLTNKTYDGKMPAIASY